MGSYLYIESKINNQAIEGLIVDYVEREHRVCSSRSQYYVKMILQFLQRRRRTTSESEIFKLNFSSFLCYQIETNAFANAGEASI